MASIRIHLAIAKLFAERNNVRDPAAFYKGTVDPDLTEKKDPTHYGTLRMAPELSAWECVKDRVDLSKFLTEHKLDNDYTRGHFLHLVTDFKFFREFFGREFLENADKLEFIADYFYSFDTIAENLIKKYGLDKIKVNNLENVKSAASRTDNVKDGYSPKCIIDTARIDAFIREVAAVDLDDYASKARK